MSLDLTHMLPIEMQLRGWQLTVDETELAMLSAPGHGGFFVDDLAQASDIARAQTQAFDQVQHWARVERWQLRKRTMQRRAVSERYGSTSYVSRWSQLAEQMQQLREGTIKPFRSRAASDVAARRAEKVSSR